MSISVRNIRRLRSELDDALEQWRALVMEFNAADPDELAFEQSECEGLATDYNAAILALQRTSATSITAIQAADGLQDSLATSLDEIRRINELLTDVLKKRELLHFTASEVLAEYIQSLQHGAP